MPQTLEAVAPPRSVAFLGLGAMGLPMAVNLVQAGFEVIGFDLSSQRRERFAAAGGRTTDEAGDATAGAAAVVTMLPDGPTVARALGEDGVAKNLDAGSTLVIDMSSSAPTDTVALGRDLEARGVPVVDAPVSGGVARAEAGTLTIMVGGREEHVSAALPVLSAMGSRVVRTGPLGSGHAMKALNNYVSAAGLVAASEALLVGKAFGLDPSVMLDVLNASSGRNNSTENKMARFVLSGAYDSGFALALMAKDLRIARELADHVGQAAPLSAACAELWARAKDTMPPIPDHTEIFRYLESLTSGE